MRQNQNPRRSRGRINNGRNQNGKPVQDNQQNRRSFASSSRQYESQGPDGKNRGTAGQLFERYTTLSREVVAQDRTLAEAFSQFADHYYRVAAEAAGFEAESSRNRDVAPANGDAGQEVREHNAPRHQPDSHGNNGNVAIASETNFVSGADEGEPVQPAPRQPSIDGEAREGGEGQWGNSRRRRAQNYRDARNSGEESSPRTAPSVPEVVEVAAQAVPQAAPQAAGDSAALVVEVKPRRRIMRPASEGDKGGVVETASPVQAEAAEQAAAEVVKPRRGRPRKVVLSDEPAL